MFKAFSFYSPTGLLRSALLVLTMSLSAQVWSLEVGDTAPQLVGRDISNSIFSLSRLDAKPKVLNFFWVNCQPCKQEIPLLAKKEKTHPNVEFVVIHAEINSETETNYDISDIQSFAKSLSAHPKKMVLGSERIKQQYGIEAFPYSVLLSAQNKVEKVLYGFNERTINELDKWLALQQ